MIGRVCWRFAHVDSTQNVAFRLAELGAPHGSVVRAGFQSVGRGRQNRNWEAPAGSALMFSVILRPRVPLHHLGTISILVAEAVADSVAERVADPVQIKWPNDVLINGKKTSGILIQTRINPDPVAILGIGINIDFPSDSLPESATCVNRHANSRVDSDELFGSILERLDSLWGSFEPDITSEQAGRLDSRLWLCGEMVSILDANREITGRILGIARNGGLRLAVEGSERVVVAGEIVRGPRPVQAPTVN